MLDEKMRKKWDDHIANCKRYLSRLKPGEESRYKFHYECEIAIDDYLRELEAYRPGDGTTIHFIMGNDEPLRDQHGSLLNEKVTVTLPDSMLDKDHADCQVCEEKLSNLPHSAVPKQMTYLSYWAGCYCGGMGCKGHKVDAPQSEYRPIKDLPKEDK